MNQKLTKNNCFKLPLIILIINLIKLVENKNVPQVSSSIEFILDLKTKINKLTINQGDTQNDLYVASTNHLYKIIDEPSKSELKIAIDLSTGPKAQKQQCAFITEYSSSSTQCIKYICDEDTAQPQLKSLLKSKLKQNLVDNDNRLLLIDYKNQHLIECGTVDYGGCRLRQLSDLQIIGCNYSAPVIPFNSASGVVVSSSSSLSSTSRIDDSSLYLMVSNEYDPIERLDKTDFPIFSIRYLATTTKNTAESKQQLQLRQPLFQSKYPIESMNYDQTIFNSDFHMKIIYSFKHNGFVYFLFTITNKILSESCNRVDVESMSNKTTPKIVTRMLRICDSKWSGDSNQRGNRESNSQDPSETLASLLTSSETNSATLTETVLDCDDQISGSKHYLLQSAYFHEISSKNPNGEDNSILFLNFNTTVCKVRIKEIENHFLSMLRKCLDGDNNFAELVSPYSNKNTWKTPCRCSYLNDYSRKSPQSDDRKLFCHNDFFNYINSRKTLTIQSINLNISDKIKPISSLVSLNTDSSEKLVLILSTLDAKVYMFLFDPEKNLAQKYDQVNLLSSQEANLASSQSINLAVVENSMQRTLFATYDRYLYKINLQNCKQFHTCDTCLNGFESISNPFCGWCVYKQECSMQKDCILDSNSEYLSSTWLSKSSTESTKCPSVINIKPSRFFDPNLENTKWDEYRFRLSFNLLPSKEYFCVLSEQKIKASYLPDTGELSCNLGQDKTRFGLIKSKFSNLSLEIRAGSNLIASTSLYAFNCSYFKDCNQCLSKQLSGSCTWCAKNSKCIYSSKLDAQCPNEVEYYNSGISMCTSMQMQKTSPKLEIPFSADSTLTQMLQPLIENRHKTYQKTFKCVFSKNKISNKARGLNFTSTNLNWLSGEDGKLTPFDCVYSPLNDPQLDPQSALQTVYLSVWWSSKENDQTRSLLEWNQVKFKRENEEDLFSEKDKASLNENDYLEINILNCEIKASSCGKCLNTQLIAIGCGWCKTFGKCTMQKDCKKNINSQDWFNTIDKEEHYCPDPTIKEIKPFCGPKIKAGTLLTLVGENLGRSTDEIEVRMKPVKSGHNFNYNNQDLYCTMIEQSYVQATRIVCKTVPIEILDPISLQEVNEYSVYVVTNTKGVNKFSSFNQSNQFIYKYVNPEIYSIEPMKGIKSGGTLVKITGKHLSCGSDFSIKFIASGTYCSIVNITTVSSQKQNSNDNDYDIVYCKTPVYNQNEWNQGNSLSGIPVRSVTSIQIKMDEFAYTLPESNFKFEYVDDPKITNIEPDRTILSGGVTLNIKGKDFDLVQSTNLILSPIPITSNNRLYSIDSNDQENNLNILKTECLTINSTIIQCQLPEIKDRRLLQSGQQSIEYSIYIQFNEIRNKYANQLPGDLQQIQVYPDPVFEQGQIFSDKSQIILIKGENLLRGVQESEYRVWVGPNVECNITSITMSIIACFLPDHNIFLNKDKKRESRFQLFGRKKRDLIDTDFKDLPIISALTSSKAKSYEVRVQIGKNLIQTIGLIKYEKDAPNKYDVIEIKYIIFAAGLISLILLITMIGFFIILKRRQNKQIRQLKRMQTEFENLEMRVARECKEAFTELQMDIGELANTLNQTGAPFNDFQTYCMKILFPNASETEKYYMTTMIDLRLSSANKENVKNGVLMFSQLILNKKFLLTFIHTLEADSQSFLLQDRVNLASYLSICLHDRLDYFTDILMTLLAELIEKIIETKNNPKILFRRNESIAEKMLTNWFAFLLYDFIKDCAGTPLYILFLSIKQQIYKGPVDAISCEARYSLSEDKLIRQSIDYETITVRVQLQDFDDVMHEISVKVLNCDTITQVKEKILDAFFKGYPYSKRPHVDDLDLIYIPSEWNKNGRLILFDEDKTCKIDSDDFKRLNTLAHYKVTNGALLVLVSRQSYQLLHSSVNDACNSYTMLDTVKNAENMTLLSKSSKGSSSPPTYSKLSSNGLNEYNNGGVYSGMNGSSVGLTESLFNQNHSTRINHNNSHHQLALNTNNSTKHSNHSSGNQKIKKYHLIKSNDLIHSTTPSIKDDKKQEIAAKLVSEVYLTRLLATKGGMQSYVDDFFETVFSTAHGSNVLPFAIKYLFDFLDEQANIHGITDPDVVYTWKSNSLPLRFWVNIIKNPDFVFDIFKSNIVDASLSVIASTFMDSCSQSKLDLNKESPSGKLLFYKEVHKYRKWVESYYSEIKLMPKINEMDMNEMLAEESKKHSGTFNKNNAMYKLYNDYIKKYRARVENTLNDEYQDASVQSINKHLNYRLQQVIYLMDAIEV